MSTRDRRTQLIGSATLNGIDFVEVANSAQTLLVVHFLNGGAARRHADRGAHHHRRRHGPRGAVHPVQPGDWGKDGSHVTLALHVACAAAISRSTR